MKIYKMAAKCAYCGGMGEVQLNGEEELQDFIELGEDNILCCASCAVKEAEEIRKEIEARLAHERR